MRRFFGILFLLGGGIGAYFAINWIFWQHRAITTFIPVEARIEDAEVHVYRGSKSTTYTPEIHYSYTYQDKPYESSQIFPVDHSGGSAWAYDIVEEFSPYVDITGLELGKPKRATAYIDPADPGESFLLRDYSFTPYTVSMLALVGAMVGLGMISGVLSSPRDSMAAIALDTSDVRLLLPVKSLRSRANNSLAMFVAFALATIPVISHWVAIGQLAHTGGAWFILAIAGLFFVIFLTLAVRRWSLARHISDARLRVSPAPMVRGQAFDLNLESDAFAALRVKEARAHLECTEHYREKRGNKTQYGTRSKYTTKAVLASEMQVPAGQLLSGKGTITCDADAAPGSTDSKTYPYYTWRIRVEIELEGAVDYLGIFPLDVV